MRPKWPRILHILALLESKIGLILCFFAKPRDAPL